MVMSLPCIIANSTVDTNTDIAIEILGYMGAVFLTLLTYPQVYLCYKKRSAGGLAESFLFFEFMTSICFVAYGILLPSVHVIIANSAALVGTIMLIVAKIVFKEKQLTDDVATNA